jgi:hypothetical protein
MDVPAHPGRNLCAYILHELSYNLFATKATGEALQKSGVVCPIIVYPNALGVIYEKKYAW